jgi:type II secretory pathway component PulC
VPGTKPTPAPGSGGPVSCSGTTCTVTKAHFDDLIAAPERLQSQAKVVPAIRNDVHSGYKLNSVKPGSTVAQLGFRAGDKITHVNGYDLTDDVQAMQLYWSLSATKVFKIRYERGGRNAVRTVLVK